MAEQRKSVQVSKDSWHKLNEISNKTGLTYKQLIDSFVGNNDLLTTHTKWKKWADKINVTIESIDEVKTPKRKSSNIPKPDSLIIDVSILTHWKAAPKIAMKPRGDIKMRVMIKMGWNYPGHDNWDALYPKFTLNMHLYLSPFEVAFAARLRALVKAGFLIDSGNGQYSIGKITRSEWVLIEAMNNLNPTRGISTHYGISSLLKNR